jgi:hypothetical protein
VWLIAYAFNDEDTAGSAYKALRDYLLTTELDMTVYRIQLDSVWHVVTLGDGVPDLSIAKHIRKELTAGKSVELPQEVIEALQSRRKEGRIPGVFWEANHRPGQPTRPRRARAS